MMRALEAPAALRYRGLQPGVWLFAAWLFLIIDAALPTAQLLAMGSIVLPSAVPKIALMVIGAANTLLSLRWRAPPILAAWLVVFIIYLYACSTNVWNLAATEPDADSNLLYYYIGFIILTLSYSCCGTLPERTVSLTIVTLSAPLALLGLGQHILGDPILPLLPGSDSAADPSSDANSVLVATEFHGEVRGYSLFTSGMALGHFLSLTVGILIPLVYNWRGYRRLIAFLLLTLCVAAVYSTLTRAIYIQLAIVTVSALLFTLLPKTRGRVGLLNFFFGVLAALVVNIIEPMTVLSDSGVLAGDTYRLRLAEWAYCWNELTSGTLGVLLLGTGVTEGQNNFVVIDNGPLAVIYQAGIIGLLFWIAGMCILLKYAKVRLAAAPSPLTIGVAAYVTSWLSASMFNLATDEGARIAVLLVLCHSAASLSKISDAPEMFTGIEWSWQIAPSGPTGFALTPFPHAPVPLSRSHNPVAATVALAPMTELALAEHNAESSSLPQTEILIPRDLNAGA
jgi:O-antigen ligase